MRCCCPTEKWLRLTPSFFNSMARTVGASFGLKLCYVLGSLVVLHVQLKMAW